MTNSLENSSKYLSVSTDYADFLIAIYKIRKRTRRKIFIDGVMFYCNKRGQKSYDPVTNMELHLYDCVEYTCLKEVPDSIIKSILEVSDYFKLKKQEKTHERN